MNKKKITIATSSLLVVGIATSATLAYLNSTTQTNTNVFSSNKSVEIKLREKAWDGFDFNEEYPEDITPGTVVDSTESKNTIDNLGLTLAQNYYPGDVIPKDPTIKNVKEDAWVAIKVTYKNFSDRLGTINFDTTNWIKIGESSDKFDRSELYMYKEIVESPDTVHEDGSLAKITTTALFDKVTISSEIESTPNFEIKVSGYGVQVHGLDKDDAKTELLKLAGF